MEPNYQNLDPDERTNKTLAIISIVLGIISICAGLLPPVGIIAGAISLFAGIRGRRSDSRRLGTIGIIIAAFAITLSIVYWIFLSLQKYITLPQ
jgi:hypothetical protein